MRWVPMMALVLGLQASLAAQQDTAYAPAIRAGQRLNGAWTTARQPDKNGLRIDRYGSLGRRDEFLTVTLNAGFGGFLVVARENNGKVEPIGATDSLRPVSTLEIKLPTDGRYYVLAGAKLTGSYTLVTQSQGSVSELDWAALYPGGGAPSERYALLVGVNDYPGSAHDLGGGPLVDVDLMRDLLITKFGFRAKNILVLRDLEGNREQLIQAFRRHLGQAGPKGAAVFYYSGHGMQLEENQNRTGAVDREADNRDEALALWGTQGDLYGYLLDDELGVLIDELKTDRVLVILDDCHSGTSARGAESISWAKLSGSRKQPPAVLQRFAGAFTPGVQDKRIFRRDLGTELEKPVVALRRTDSVRRDPIVLAASDDSETSLGISLTLNDGSPIPVGLFTIVLYQTLLDSPATLTFQGLLEKLSPIVTQKAVEIAGKPQTPQFSGKQLRQSITRFLATATP